MVDQRLDGRLRSPFVRHRPYARGEWQPNTSKRQTAFEFYNQPFQAARGGY